MGGGVGEGEGERRGEKNFEVFFVVRNIFFREDNRQRGQEGKKRKRM